MLAPEVRNMSDTRNTSTSPKTDYGVTLGGFKNIKDITRQRLLAEEGKTQAIEITDENLQVSWAKIVEEMASKKVVYRSAILQSHLSFVASEITIHANVVALDYLKSERNRLLDFFKAYYHNEKINVLFAAKVETSENADVKVLSTKEIFEMMAQKNPNLKILKDKFGLDFEY